MDDDDREPEQLLEATDLLHSHLAGVDDLLEAQGSDAVCNLNESGRVPPGMPVSDDAAAEEGAFERIIAVVAAFPRPVKKDRLIR